MNRNRKEALKQANLSYRQSLKKSLELRLESARVAGDEKLIRQLEAEANYLHLS
jgi:ribosome-binding protein aMBF1 (putative translation factor)